MAALTLVGVVVLLWALKPEPLHPVVTAAPIAHEHVPGRSPSPFGSGAPVIEPEPAPEQAGPVAGVASATAPVLQAGPVETPAEQRDRFDKLRWFGTNPGELAALARQMDATLPAAVRRGAIEPGDALVLKADLLDVLEPDPTRRRARLVEWWNAYPLAARVRDPRRPAAAEDLRRELAALADWQAQRSEDRDAGELEEKLEEMAQR